ncbi:HET-domain-containing protein, partial [Lophiostoma macrostomum CBS 122681]
PRRILDLGSGDGLDIVLRENLGTFASYVCLSHSWGGQQPLKTTMRSLRDFQNKITWSSLPRLFQDAVTCTRKIGFRYLWIDSLCIIQDDPTDWMEQSACMVDIYRNGALTLAAACSTGAHDSLFRRLSRKHQLRQLDSGGYPLVRAWVLQERLLSARVLYFGDQELFWGCTECTDCECRGITNRRSPTQHLQIKAKFHPSTLHMLGATGIAEIWRTSIMPTYSQMKLTVETDFLPALSGIAKAIAHALRKKKLTAGYIAGMWECWFIEDCLWYVDNPGLAQRPHTWRAPSFSWGSIK